MQDKALRELSKEKARLKEQFGTDTRSDAGMLDCIRAALEHQNHARAAMKGAQQLAHAVRKGNCVDSRALDLAVEEVCRADKEEVCARAYRQLTMVHGSFTGTASA